MKNKRLPVIAIVIAVLALCVTLYPHVCGFFEVGVQAPEPVIGQVFKIRERHFNRNDPGFSSVTNDEVKIESIDGDRVFLKTSLGYEVISSRSPFMPSFEEVSTNEKDKYVEKNTILGDPLSLFPLKIGKRSSHKVTGDSTQGEGRAWEYRYDCEVTGREKVTIALGTFNTYKVVCTGAGSKNFKKTFYYDPNEETNVITERDSEHSYYSELTALPE